MKNFVLILVALTCSCVTPNGIDHDGPTLGSDTQEIQTANYLQKWTGTTYADSAASETGGLLTIPENVTINTNGDAALFSTYKGTNSDGGNIWIGGGGQSSVGSMASHAQGSANVSLGYTNLQNLTTGAYNTAVGQATMFQCTTCLDNAAIGQEALYSCTTGIENTAVGVQTLAFLTTASYNTAIGIDALENDTTGYLNTGVGAEADALNTTGYANTCVGSHSCEQGTTGYYNTAIGDIAFRYGTTGDSNTVIGYDAGDGITTGRANTIIGKSTGLSASLSNTVIISDGDGHQRIKVDSSANTTLSGTVQINSTGPKWSSGTGAPAIGCSIGDLFSRTDGAANTTLYVCTASNTWTAK